MEEEIFNAEPDPILTKGILNQLKDVEGIDEWLRMNCNLDMRKYFSAPDDKTRDTIAGHCSFARSLLKEINNLRKK